MADFETLIDMTLKVKTEENFEIKREVENFDDEETQRDIALLEENLDSDFDDNDDDESYEPETNNKTKYMEKKVKKNSYPCENCSKIFLSSSARSKHIRITHLGEKNYQCEICQKSFGQKPQLQSHLKNKHPKEGEVSEKFDCDQCSKQFSGKNILTRHIYEQHTNPNDKQFTCNLCQKSFHRKGQLRTHVKNKHEEKSAESIELNKMNRKPVEKTECPICKAIFDKTHLKRHIRTVHEKIKDFKCDRCSAEYTEKKGLKLHIKKVHDNIRDEQCKTCGKCFFSKECLNRHIKFIHEKDKLEKKFQCEMCPMAYNISYNLKNHIDRVHKKLKPFSCEICGDCFTSKLGMQQHVKSIHQGIKEYVCHICAKAYSQKTGLTQHMLYTHEKEKSVKYKKFQCTICDYVSTCDYTLNHHIKTVHHKIKEHCCDKCGKSFSSQQSLKKHDFKSHGGVDGGRLWYKCEYCIGGKALKGPGAMERHMRTVHKIENPVNIKPEGFDEKMAKKAKKLFWKRKKSEMPPELANDDDENNSEEKFAQNGLLDLSASKNNDTTVPSLPLPLSFGSYESSVKSTDPNGKPIIGELNYIPMRNSENEKDQIEENYIGSATDYAIDVTNMNTTEVEPTADELYYYDDKNDDQYMENEYFENSNNMETEMLSASKIKHEEIDMDYDNYYEGYSSDINNDYNEEEDSKTGVLKDEKDFETMDDNIGEELQKVKVEIEEEPPDDSNNTAEEQQSNNTTWEAETADFDQKFKMETTTGIEIKLDGSEVIKNRFGQVVDKMVKCDACDKFYVGKTAAKSLRSHYRIVHGAPKMKEAKNKVTKEHLENPDAENVEKCKFCDKVYVGPTADSSMKFHMKTHSGINYKCHICEKDFQHKLGSLVRHLQIKHKCENVCEKCGKAFISEEILKSHFNSKHFDQRIKTRKDGTFECKICNRELKKYGHAERHMKLFHPADGEGDGQGEDPDDDPLEDSEIKVEDENSNAKTTGENIEEDLFENGLVTMDIRVFKCEYCGKDYGQGKFAQQGLRRHIQTNHLQTRVFTCENCGKIFRYKKGLKRHQEVIHEGLRPYKCETCGKDFGEKRQYQQHVLQVHEGVRDFLCHLCNKSYPTKSTLDQHLMLKHADEMGVDCPKDWVCNVCGKAFFQAWMLKHHVHRSHTEHGLCKSCLKLHSESVTCEQCGYSHVCPQVVRKHIRRVHEGKDNSKGYCDKCGRVVSNIKRHISSFHEGRRDFKCDRCEKMFSDKSSVAKHIKTVHDGIKDKICPTCGKAFSCNKGLSRHQEQVHMKIKAHKCEFCNKSYAQADYLRIHQHTIHGKERDPKIAHKRMNQYV